MRALLFLLALAACSEGPTAGFNPHTGVTSRASGVVMIDRRYPARLEVRAVRLAKDGAEAFALLTFVTRSDLNYPKIESVWSFGRPLPYERLDRRRVGYDRQEAGRVPLTRSLVEAATAGGGLTVQLVGRRGSYGGHVPATLFAATLSP
jgi:hypothetical protein